MDFEIGKYWNAMRLVYGAAPVLIDELVKVHGTQVAVAKFLGVSQVYLSRMKTGHAQPSLNMLEKMLDELSRNPVKDSK